MGGRQTYASRDKETLDRGSTCPLGNRSCGTGEEFRKKENATFSSFSSFLVSIGDTPHTPTGLCLFREAIDRRMDR